MKQRPKILDRYPPLNPNDYATSIEEILMTYPALRQTDVISTLTFGEMY